MRVIVKLLATVDIDAGSPDEAAALVQAALADVAVTVATSQGPLPVHLGLLDAQEPPQIMGDGEDPASDE